MSAIIINYRPDSNAAAAGRLYDRLCKGLGEERVFMDVNGIEPGEDFIEILEQRLANTAVLLVLIGRDWLTCKDTNNGILLHNPNDFVRLEIGMALQSRIRVIPLLVDSATMPQPEQLPDDLKPLSRRLPLQLDHDRFDQDVARLIASLEKFFTSADPHPPASPTSTLYANGQGGPQRFESENIQAQTRQQAEQEARNLAEAQRIATEEQMAREEYWRRAEAQRIEIAQIEQIAIQKAREAQTGQIQNQVDPLDVQAWTNACKAHSYKAYEQYVRSFPAGKYCHLALQRYRQLKPFWTKDVFS